MAYIARVQPTFTWKPEFKILIILLFPLHNLLPPMTQSRLKISSKEAFQKAHIVKVSKTLATDSRFSYLGCYNFVDVLSWDNSRNDIRSNAVEGALETNIFLPSLFPFPVSARLSSSMLSIISSSDGKEVLVIGCRLPFRTYESGMFSSMQEPVRPRLAWSGRGALELLRKEWFNGESMKRTSS